MALPDTRFVYCPPLQIYFVDKDDGFPLAAGIVTFYVDSDRTVLKPIYKQVQQSDNTYLFVEISNPVTLTSVGTFGDDSGNDIDVYLYPYTGAPTDETQGAIELYYITVESSGHVDQFTREAFPPNMLASADVINTFEGTDNELANPQFVEVLFDPNPVTSEFTFSVSTDAEETPIAPDWFVRTYGTGTVTVKQVSITDSTVATNPPYALDINSTGITSIELIQRLEASPRLLHNGFISGYFLAKSVSAGQIFVVMDYVPSSGATAVIAEGFTNNDSSFTPLFGTVAIDGVANTDAAPAGYVDIVMSWNVNTHLQITSLQICGVANINSSVQFLQQSTARQIDHLFHYYKPQLEYKPIPSYLVGWDFPLNPAQFNGNSGSLGSLGAANKSNYIWDQTILFAATNNTMSYARSAQTSGLVISTASSSAFALVQYIPAPQAKELLSQRNAVSLKGYISTGTGTLNGTVSLYYTSGTLPDIKTPNFNSIVSSISATGVPTVTSSPSPWVVVPNVELGNNAAFQLTTTEQELAFSGFGFDDPTVAQGAATYMAIVVAFAPLASSQAVEIDYIGLFGGDIATRPAPQTPDQVLRECQYYYQKSFVQGVTPAAGVGLGNGENYYVITKNGANNFGPFVSFNPPMYQAPTSSTIAFYNPVVSAGTSQIRNITTNQDFVATTLIGGINPSKNGFGIAGTTDAGGALSNLIAVNWTADARLGVI